MSISIVELKPYRAEDFLSCENFDRIDATVTEIFQMMFGFDIRVVEPTLGGESHIECDERTAVVGLSGTMRGCCQIRISTQGARSIASAMLGGEPIDEEDNSINDALGELCNT